MKIDWPLILGPAVTAAIVSAFVTLISNFRQQSLNYITAERAPWRTRIKDAMQDLLSAFGSAHETELALQKIKSEINPYGANTKKTLQQKWKRRFGCLRRKKADISDNYYLSDGHIWNAIANYEREPSNHQLLEVLLFKMELLLKYDWERSKKEVRSTNMYLPLSLICSVASAGFLAPYVLSLFKQPLTKEQTASLLFLGLVCVTIQMLPCITMITDLKFWGILLIYLIWVVYMFVLYLLFAATNNIFMLYSIFLSLGGFLFSILSSEKSLRRQQRIYITVVKKYEDDIELTYLATHHSPLVGEP